MKFLQSLLIVCALTPSLTGAQSPNPAAEYLKNGDTKYYAGDFTGAIADYTRAIEIDPQNPGAYFRRGVVYDRQGQTDAALADYGKAIELRPRNTFAYNNRALLLIKNGQMDAAIADWTKAVESDPKYANGYYNRGKALHQKKDFDGAIADFTRGLRSSPTLRWRITIVATPGRTKEIWRVHLLIIRRRSSSIPYTPLLTLGSAMRG